MTLKKKAVSGVSWSFFQQFGNQAVTFIVSIILARLLLPKEFGLIGMISIFVGIGNVLMNSGLTQSLIRNPKNRDKDYSTVFFFNLTSSVLIYFLTFLLAPLVAKFYNQAILTDIIRLYCLCFIINAFTAVQQTRMTIGMNFKSQAIIGIPSTFIGGVTGITLAYSGYREIFFW